MRAVSGLNEVQFPKELQPEKQREAADAAKAPQ